MNKKFYKTKLTNSERVIRAIRNLESLDNQIMMGSPSSVKKELDDAIKLISHLNDELILSEKFHKNSLLESKIREIEKSKDKKIADRGLINLLFGSQLNFDNENNRIKELRDQLEDVRFFKLKEDYYDFRKNNIENTKKISKYTYLLKKSLDAAVERESSRKNSMEIKRSEQVRREAERLAEEERIKALAAAHIGKSRQRAATIKNGLLEQLDLLSYCPYCGNDIGDTPHADHIYPVSRGGLSTADNMIYVCRKCNSKKSDKTLIEFIHSTDNLDFKFIMNNLKKLKKRM